MAAWEESKAELEKLEATIIVASVDSLEQTQEVAGRGLTYPVAYGVTQQERGVSQIVSVRFDETRESGTAA